MKDQLVGKIMTKFVGLRAKTQSYILDDGNEDKKAKDTKKCVIKRKLKFENHENCLQATQLDNKINYLKKVNLTQIVLKKHYKELISLNVDKRMQSIDSIETFAYRMSKDKVNEKVEIKFNNIIKRYKND